MNVLTSQSITDDRKLASAVLFASLIVLEINRNIPSTMPLFLFARKPDGTYHQIVTYNVKSLLVLQCTSLITAKYLTLSVKSTFH